MGGCNYKLNVCYKDTFLLNTETLFWTKIADEGQTVFTERDGHTANPVGELIVLFGGCKLMDSCSNDIMVLNTNTYCPLNCSLNGVCRNKRCLCYQGYQGFFFCKNIKREFFRNFYHSICNLIKFLKEILLFIKFKINIWFNRIKTIKK